MLASSCVRHVHFKAQIHDAELWNVEAPSGKRVGQAVLVSHWQLEDGQHCGPAAPIVEGDVTAAGAIALLETSWSVRLK